MQISNFRLKRPGIIDVFIFFQLAVQFFYSTTYAVDPGLGWHLRSGEWMLLNKKIINADYFLFTTINLPWINDQWLADVIFWYIYDLGGMPLLHVTAICICMTSFVLLPSIQSRHACKSFFILIITVLLVSLASSVQWFIRPVTISFLLLSLVATRFSFHKPLSRVELFLTPVIFAFWTNIHPAFPLGLFYFAVVLIQKIYDASKTEGQKQRNTGLIFCFLFSILATLINPYGYKLHQQIISLLSSEFFMKLNVEWSPPRIDSLAFMPFFLCLLILLTSLVFGGYRVLKLKDWIIGIFFSYMALKHNRYIPFFAATIAPIISLSLNYSIKKFHNSILGRSDELLDKINKNKTIFKYAATFALIILVVTAINKSIPFKNPSYSDFAEWYPKEQVQRLKAIENQNIRLFHTPDWGGYLSWSLPNILFFIDDRNQLLGEEIYRDYFKIRDGLNDWIETFNKYNFTHALILENEKIYENLVKIGWKTLNITKTTDNKKIILLSKN